MVGGGALALARDLGRDEAEARRAARGCARARPGQRALVDDQVHVEASAWARIRSRQAATARRTRSSSRLAERGHVPRRETITSCAPSAGCDANRSGSAGPRRGGSGSAALASPVGLLPAPSPPPRPAPDRGSAPTRRHPGVSAAPPSGRSPRPRAGCGPRGPSQNGQVSAASGFDSPLAGRERVGRSARPGARIDSQAGELVDADLGGGQAGVGGVGRRGEAAAAGLGARDERLQQAIGRSIGGEDDRRVLVDAHLEQRLQVAQLERRRVLADDLGRLGELLRGLELALGGDDLGAPLALGLGLAGHRPLHLSGQLDVLDLDGRDLDAPGLGLLVDDLLQLVVERSRSASSESSSALPSTERSVVWAICEVATR